MRLLMIVAGAALALSACGNNDQKDNSQNVDENLTAENIVSNDVTAIDAVTADAANMAADVNYMEADNELGNATNAIAPSAGSKPNRAATPRPKPTTNTASNAASNAPANSTE